MKSNKLLRGLGILSLVILNISCDQISKDLVRKNVRPADYIEVVDNHLILTNIENTGAMLGFGSQFSPLLKLILFQLLPTLVLFVLLFRILQKSVMDQRLAIAFAFVIGGGIGNLWDRVVNGSVTDFFQIKIGFLKTGIFNMADVSVTCGVLFILFLILRQQKIAL